MKESILYKAIKDFQESAPYAHDLKTVGDQIEWRDGDYQYHLKVEDDDTATNAKPDRTSQTDQTTIPKEAAADKP